MQFSALPAVIFKVYSFLFKEKKKLNPPSISNGAGFTNYIHLGKFTETLQVSDVKKTIIRRRGLQLRQTLSHSVLFLTGRVEYQSLIFLPVQHICFAFQTFKVDEYV